MKNLIIRRNLIYFLIISLFLYIITLFSFHQINLHSIKNSIKNYTELVRLDINLKDLESSLEKYETQNKWLRISLFDPNLNPLYDNLIQINDSHYDREELKKTGTFIIRYSSTLNRKMIYYAVNITEDDYVLRIAIPYKNINTFVIIFSIIYFLILGIIGMISFYFYRKNYGKMQDLINKIYEDISGIMNGKGTLRSSHHLEFNRMYSLIDELNLKINSYVNRINEEKEKLDLTLNNMNEGLILLSEEKQIILANDYVCRIFGIRKEEVIQEKLRFLIRDLNILKLIDEALLKNKFFSAECRYKNYILEISVIPVKSSGENSLLNIQRGTIIILNDVSQIKRLLNYRKEFFSDASHELKTPLTTIMGLSEIISMKLYNEENELKAIAEKIHSNGLKMNNIVNDLLDLSRFDQNKVIEKREEFKIKDLIYEVTDDLKILSQERGIQLKLEISDIILYADKENFYKLIKNIVENSIKYNQLNGSVFICAKLENNSFHLIVEDTGIGIKEEDQELVFNRFYRVDKARNSKDHSTGLGLAIVKHICLFYGAQLKLESKKDLYTKIEIVFDERILKK